MFKSYGQTNRRFLGTGEKAEKRIVCSSVLFVVCAMFLLVGTCSCGSGSDSFKIEGKFKNLNQGEFYIYGLDGGLSKIDTIRVERGSFVYSMPCSSPATLMLVFPNFSEQPIFAVPGKTAKLKGDASSLKDMEVKGTKDNELMNSFRQLTVGMSPPEVVRQAELFITDHPESEVAVYLARRYFMLSASPDYKKATTLFSLLAEKQAKNGLIIRLQQKNKELSRAANGTAIPDFTDTDLKGRKVSKADLTGSPIAVVTTCASWHYESQNVLRQLHRLQRKNPGKIKVVSIFLDGNRAEMNRQIERDTINWPIIADPLFFEGKTLQKFGLSTVGDNLLYHKGRVVAAHLKPADLTKEIEKLL